MAGKPGCCGAPLGNKNALGNNGGRPHTDLSKIATQMIDWVKNEDSINLNGFCGKYFYNPKMILHWSKHNLEFCDVYETVKAILADRREKLLCQNKLHQKAYAIHCSVYDQFQRDEKLAILEFEAKLKSNEQQSFKQDDIERLEAILFQMRNRQEACKEAKRTYKDNQDRQDTRSIDDNMNNSEETS